MLRDLDDSGILWPDFGTAELETPLGDLAEDSHLPGEAERL